MTELRDIFRAEDGSEWHAKDIGRTLIFVNTAVGCGPIFKNFLKCEIEGPYKVWSKK